MLRTTFFPRLCICGAVLVFRFYMLYSQSLCFSNGPLFCNFFGHFLNPISCERGLIQFPQLFHYVHVCLYKLLKYICMINFYSFLSLSVFLGSMGQFPPSSPLPASKLPPTKSPRILRIFHRRWQSSSAIKVREWGRLRRRERGRREERREIARETERERFSMYHCQVSLPNYLQVVACGSFSSLLIKQEDNKLT